MLKILRQDLTSYNWGDFQYVVDKWVKPEFGKLFVFDTIENLLNFETNLKEYRVFECQVRGAVPFSGRIPSIEDFWVDYEEIKDSHHSTRVPKGT